MQKYESGANRLSISMLSRMARALDVSPARLVEEVTAADDAPASGSEPLESDRCVLELVIELQRLRSPAMRQSIRRLVRALAETEAAAENGVTAAGQQMRPRT